MGQAAGGASLLAVGLTAFSDVSKGEATQAADTYQANELRTKAQYAGAAAAETNATLSDRLATTLGHIDAVRAAAHTDPTSPTTVALRNRASDVANQERAIRVGNLLAQKNEDTYSADYIAASGKYAMNMGYVNAATDVFGDIAKTNPSTFGLPGGGPSPSAPYVSDQAIS